MSISKLSRITNPQAAESDQKTLSAGNRAFAASLYQKLRSTDGNLIFSPYSISLALAMAYAETGEFTNAQKTAAYALKLATAYNMTNDVPAIRQHLRLYQNNQPFRQSFLYTNAPAKEPQLPDFW